MVLWDHVLEDILGHFRSRIKERGTRCSCRPRGVVLLLFLDVLLDTYACCWFPAYLITLPLYLLGGLGRFQRKIFT